MNTIELGDHVREPRMAGQAGIVVQKDSLKKVPVLLCYNNKKCIPIVVSDTLLVWKQDDVERLTGEPINGFN